MCTKRELGGSFCIERLSMNVPFDRYHTKANTDLGRKKKRTSHSFPLSWRYIKCYTRKTVYEKVSFFQASYIVKEVRCIHLTNLYSLCEQVARLLLLVLGDRLDFLCRCSYRTFVTKLRTFPIMESKC